MFATLMTIALITPNPEFNILPTEFPPVPAINGYWSLTPFGWRFVTLPPVLDYESFKHEFFHRRHERHRHEHHRRHGHRHGQHRRR